MRLWCLWEGGGSWGGCLGGKPGSVSVLPTVAFFSLTFTYTLPVCVYGRVVPLLGKSPRLCVGWGRVYERRRHAFWKGGYIE